ncbi:hypothetical protein NEMBOFW57_009286 [Staphylotrichum longicolle]|uniref:Uncharacterized protein n=1 Tax=Staphylotrichum longicolle TaxID=669026 RepID=A0AAD4ESL5_9PEZI|nr:hypothetical protein NEMBOFW57_009286 [Staphylotrichum longicolle]
MPILARMPEWRKKLRQTTAARVFQRCRPDEFPLTQVQSLTSSILDHPLTLLGRRPTPPQTNAADDLLLEELEPLKGELYIYEAAVVGCLHLFTYEMARGHLCNRIRPNLEKADKDLVFKSRVSVFLQTIIIAQKADLRLVHDGEALAARELLRILHLGQRKEFPSVVKLLAAVTDTDCEELLPFDFLAEVLRRAKYKETLEAKLTALRRSQEWWEAYRLVEGLRDLPQRRDIPQAVRRWLPEIFNRYPMWASWQPNLVRIRAWEVKVSDRQRVQLAPVLELEGPDTTPQQRGTLRFSEEGAFVGSRAQGLWRGKDILDHLLGVLDRAVAVGPHAIDLFIRLCASASPGRPLMWHTLFQADAGLEPGQDSVAKVLCEFVRVLEPQTRLRDRMHAFATALPLLQLSPRLQDTFGDAADIAVRGPKALTDAQKHFCGLLLRHEPAEWFGLEVRALCRALLNAQWLHERWKPAFLEMLGALPQTTSSARASARSRPPTRPPRARRRWTTSPRPSAAPSLDADRAALRKALHAVRARDLRLATACLATSQREYDAFVREVARIVVVDSDQACVNLARFLAPLAVRAGGGRDGVAECWRALLLHLMRRRPRGLLERLGARLPVQSWNSWVESLRHVLGERHLGSQGGLGFTLERMRQITQWKMGIGRVHSQSTASTVSAEQPE